MNILQFRFPTEIRFGAGARASLDEFADRYRVARPLLVTDAGLPETDAYRMVAERLERRWSGNWRTFNGVRPNPHECDVEQAFEAYRSAGCDAVVGLGGGSALDAAKALRLKIAQPDRPLCEILSTELPDRLAPFCAIPTTAGTGSEVGRSAVITTAERGRKVVLGASPMMTDMAILDAELTVGLPPHLTAATGMDAMTHAIESYVCPMFHPMCDAIALEAIRFVREYLPRAVADGADIDARGRMLMAAAMGAVAFQKDLGAAHSLAHPLSTEFGVHHGLANAIVLANVVRFNGQENTAQYARVAEALGLEPTDNPAAQVADAIESFNRWIGIDQRLRDVGVPGDALPQLARLAIEDPCHTSNPRRCTEADLLALYKSAW